ncbi:MAG: hypothetical protein M9920_13880 [Verrucomicrobiae bacterium]|nr:hypothetical protein [Verrucomicrobiae bacterium]
MAITDEGNRTRRYDYDSLGRLYRATDLSGATWWTNQFDAETGALTNVLSPTGETLSYTYDDLDNVKSIRFGDGNSLTNFYNEENRLSGVRLPTGVALTNHYDFAGRLTNRSSTLGETASFEYNGNDAVTVMTDNTGGTTNRYDAAGRLWGIDYPSGAVELDTPTITGSVPPKNDLAPEELLASERFSCEAPRYGLDFPPYCGRV